MIEFFTQLGIGLLLGLPIALPFGVFIYCWLRFKGKHPVKTCEHCFYYDDGRNHCWYRNGDPDAEQTVFDYTEACEHFEDEKKTCRMKNVLYRFVMLFRVLADKDVMLLSVSKSDKASIITASDNPQFDEFANNLFKLLKKNENLH